jgi:amino-acid N-acetyltransferase
MVSRGSSSFRQEFFIDLLSSAATKRDAKAYISRLQASPSATKKKTLQTKKTSFSPESETPHYQANLGTIFGHARAVEQSPRFSQDSEYEIATASDEQQAHHLALVKLVGPEVLDDSALEGTGLTLSQLSRLSMTPCVVLDSSSSVQEIGLPRWRQQMGEQADRLARAIYQTSGVEARILDNVYNQPSAQSLPRIMSRKLLLAPIRGGKIPIILPLAYSDETQTMELITADQAILALTREFAGLNVQMLPDEEPATMTQRVQALQKQASLDRLIILDPQGGIPRPSVPGSGHVFLNMEQEYHDVRKDLLYYTKDTGVSCPDPSTSPGPEPFSPCMSGLSSMSVPANRESVVKDVFVADNSLPPAGSSQTGLPNFSRHLENLDLLHKVLAYLPPSSSAIVTTPVEAAKSSKSNARKTTISAVGTRTQKNPLIHNLLTDKPAFSASLPRGRLGRSNDSSTVPHGVSTSTFVKRGMPLTIIPDPRSIPWTPDSSEEPRLRLTDPRIDLSRLVHLIDDSFNRKLDVEHYLDRVNDRIAGLIIAGEYEGGALLTWETPPGVSKSHMARQVPYLDKFAVLKRSQGGGGVADIVFNAMVRGCFPNGVCWRSRRNNPVNKWYFERARGTWKLPGTNWTMFWTTEGVETGRGERFQDYEAVCRGVQPSWADKTKMAD